MVQDRRILNRTPSRGQDQDWTHEHAESAFGALAAPASHDWRSPAWPISDQGDTGSCVGWAAAEGVMRPILARSNKIALSQSMSPRFTWMAAKETDEFRSQATTFVEYEGTSIKAACRICTRFGALRESDLPFSGKLFRGETDALYAIAARFRAQSYFNLGRAPTESWRRWIFQHGPILIGLDVDQTWDDASSDILDEFRPDTTRGGHAASIVGYTPSTFIVRNSWGQDWGELGFANVSDRYARAAFTEAYGIIV